MEKNSRIKKELVLLMVKYKCGHSSEIIIMNGGVLSISAWLEWKDSVGFDGDKSQCWECYCKEKELVL